MDKQQKLSKFYHLIEEDLDFTSDRINFKIEWQVSGASLKEQLKVEKVEQKIDCRQICAEGGLSEDNEISSHIIFEEGTVEIRLGVDKKDGVFRITSIFVIIEYIFDSVEEILKQMDECEKVIERQKLKRATQKTISIASKPKTLSTSFGEGVNKGIMLLRKNRAFSVSGDNLQLSSIMALRKLAEKEKSKFTTVQDKVI